MPFKSIPMPGILLHLAFCISMVSPPQGAYTELRLAEGVRSTPSDLAFGYTMRPYAEVQDLSTPH